MEPFAHLHVHTEYSLLDGQSKISRLWDKAAKDNMPGFAITDHGNMFGIKEFFDIAKKENKKRKGDGLTPIKPIFGCEVYVAHRSLDKKEGRQDQSGWHLILLAKNKAGYQNLIKAVSIGWVDGYYMRPRIDHDVLEKYHENLICCSACIGGEVAKKFDLEGPESAEEAILWHKNLFGDDYYLEMQRHISKDPLYNPQCYEKQKPYNEFLMEMSQKHGIKLICTNDVHFVDEENGEAHDHLICMNTGKDLDDPTRMRYTKQEWFKTTAEMNELFADVPEALRNTIEIVDKCEEYYNIENDPIMPNFEIPASFGLEEEYRQRFTHDMLFDEMTRDENGNVVLSQEEAEKKFKKLGNGDLNKVVRIKFEADYLRHLTLRGARDNHYLIPEYGYEGDPMAQEMTDDEIIAALRPDVWERIKFELHIMKTMGFPGYFLIVSDFIRACREELGVSVGPGRGSAAGSAVAYCLGITKIDPIKYDLLFERFLNPDRISLPDIDTDFDDDGRPRVIEWVQNKYGSDRVSHIITYGTMATKMVLKDMARVEKVPIPVANHLAGLVPDRMPEENGKPLKCNLKNCIKVVPELAEACESSDPAIRNVMRLAQMLEGNVRGTGVHACGMIIGRDPIDTVVPVSVVDDHGTKLLVTQYDGHVIESTGLIKMDFLGLKTLGIINEALDNIKETNGIEIDIDHIPIDDKQTYELFASGRTVGTFQFESPGMQKYLKELHPDCIGDIVAMNALYRPGPMDYIPSFIARKTGKEPITYDLDACEEYLKDTYGITVYQEQVMLLSRKLANFTRGESDALRKAMGKKKKDIVDAMKPKFIEGGVKNGHDPKILEKIWADWEKFASYAFNKSHAVCYAWVAYQTAYLKAHYPAEYMSAVLSRSLNDVKELGKQMDECRAMGLEVKGPDVNMSRQRYSVDAEGAVRYGLAGIKGFGEGAADAVVNERKANGPFKDIFDFVERVDLGAINRKALETLVYSGAFDSLGKVRREQYVAKMPNGESFLDLLLRYGQKYRAEKQSNETSLFGALSDVDVTIQHPTIPEGIPMSTLERLNLEKEHVGLYLSAHPLDDYKLQLKYACNTRMNELESIPRARGREEMQQKLAELEQRPEEMERIRQIQSREIICGGLVTGWREGVSQKGNTYGILTVEDYSGKHEFPLFGESYPAFRGYGKEGMFILIHAKYVPGKYLRTPPRTIFDLNFEILKIEQLDLVADKLIEDFTVRVDSLKITDQIVHMLQSELLAKPDNSIAQKPASTLLYFEVCDAIKNYNVRLFCREHKVRVSNELVEYVRSLDGVECSINGHLVVDERTTAEEEEDDGIVDESADLLTDD
ncbi:MAG: DNA polymerase III subunit alpha [Bacteroidales bacterium]|nr:DNA polymerase III subunit alpha [Bacteroidales bacterium]